MLQLKHTPSMIAQYYTLRQIGKSKQEAREMLKSKSFNELDEITHIKDIVLGSKKIFEEYFLKTGTIKEDEFFFSNIDRDYFYSIGDKVVCNFNSEEQLCETLVVAINKVCTDVLKEKDITKKVFIKGLLLIEPIIRCCGYAIGEEDDGEEFKFNLSKEMQIAYSKSLVSDN